MGYVLLASAFALATAAGAAVARRGYGGSRAERALVTLTCAQAFLVLPVHALGWANALTPTSAFASIAITSGAAFVLAVAGERASERARQAALDALGLLALPFLALRDAVRARSASAVALSVVMLAFVYSAIAAWLAPTNSWDGNFYHEPLVGFAIQMHGFAWLDLPVGLDMVNGFPRLAEDLVLVFALFTGRQLVDLAQHVTIVTALLAVYVLVRRFTGNGTGARALAVGLSCAFFAVPAVYLQLRTTYIDVTVAAALVSAIVFATRPRFRPVDLLLFALLAGTYLGMKPNAPMLAGPLCLVAFVRALGFVRRPRALHALATIAVGALLVLAIGAPRYVRGYLEEGNPVWPVQVTIAPLGIAFPGSYDIQDQQKPFDEVLDMMLAPPDPGGDYADARRRSYGHTFPFLILPLALLAMALAFGRFALALVARQKPDPLLMSFVGLVALGIVLALPSPAYWWGRFNLHAVAVCFAAAGYALRGPTRRYFAEAVIGAATLVFVLTATWAEPGWEVSPDEMKSLLAKSPADRAVTPIGILLPPEPIARAREAELGPGALLAFDDGFVGFYWNETYSNRVLYVPFRGTTDAYLAKLDEVGATWVLTKADTPTHRTLSRAPGWEPVGALNNFSFAFRRRR